MACERACLFFLSSASLALLIFAFHFTKESAVTGVPPVLGRAALFSSNISSIDRSTPFSSFGFFSASLNPGGRACRY